MQPVVLLLHPPDFLLDRLVQHVAISAVCGVDVFLAGRVSLAQEGEQLREEGSGLDGEDGWEPEVVQALLDLQKLLLLRLAH